VPGERATSAHSAGGDHATNAAALPHDAAERRPLRAEATMPHGGTVVATRRPRPQGRAVLGRFAVNRMLDAAPADSGWLTKNWRTELTAARLFR
jgi:hypothetical protein